MYENFHNIMKCMNNATNKYYYDYKICEYL